MTNTQRKAEKFRALYMTGLKSGKKRRKVVQDIAEDYFISERMVYKYLNVKELRKKVKS